MEKRMGTPVEKWDEVNGRADTKLPQELDPNTIGNVRRGLEDQVEQNDNNLDGIINNVATDDKPAETVKEKEERTSLLQELKKSAPEKPKVPHPTMPELVL